MNLRNRLGRHFAACAAAAVVAGSADATVVTWDCNLVIPGNIDGLYINIETQATGSSGSGVAGWDINPYGGTGLNFFAATGTTYVRLAASGGPTNLALGYVVDSASTFANSTSNVFAAGSPSGWQLDAVNYFGFRFLNGAGSTLYGYGVMEVGSTATTRTLLSLSYEDSGAGITIVPAPGAVALLGLAGLAGSRRRRG
jgi:MYXO-CTERM domain-containing protein